MSQAYVYTNAPRTDILQLIPPDGKVIGSVGCGYAATEAELVRAGRTVYGVDIAPQVAEIARQRLARFDLLKPGDELPWAPRSLDGLILADVIEHVPQAWIALASWSRCVRPGGWVVISVPNMRHIDVLARFILTGDWPEHDSGIFDQTHVQVMSMRRLLRWAAGAGLRLEKVFDCYGPGGRKRTLFRTLDLLTLRIFRTWTMYQLQCVFRVLSPREAQIAAGSADSGLNKTRSAR
jgi:SAM-dependent methyltransferase